jgi:hypothetical protein
MFLCLSISFGDAVPATVLEAWTGSDMVDCVLSFTVACVHIINPTVLRLVDCCLLLLLAVCLDQQRHGAVRAVIPGIHNHNAQYLSGCSACCCALQDAWTSSDMVDCVLSFAATQLMDRITTHTGMQR